MTTTELYILRPDGQTFRYRNGLGGQITSVSDYRRGLRDRRLETGDITLRLHGSLMGVSDFAALPGTAGDLFRVRLLMDPYAVEGTVARRNITWNPETGEWELPVLGAKASLVERLKSIPVSAGDAAVRFIQVARYARPGTINVQLEPVYDLGSLFLTTLAQDAALDVDGAWQPPSWRLAFNGQQFARPTQFAVFEPYSPSGLNRLSMNAFELFQAVVQVYGLRWDASLSGSWPGTRYRLWFRDDALDVGFGADPSDPPEVESQTTPKGVLSRAAPLVEDFGFAWGNALGEPLVTGFGRHVPQEALYTAHEERLDARGQPSNEGLQRSTFRIPQFAQLDTADFTPNGAPGGYQETILLGKPVVPAPEENQQADTPDRYLVELEPLVVNPAAVVLRRRPDGAYDTAYFARYRAQTYGISRAERIVREVELHAPNPLAYVDGAGFPELLTERRGVRVGGQAYLAHDLRYSPGSSVFALSLSLPEMPQRLFNEDAQVGIAPVVSVDAWCGETQEPGDYTLAVTWSIGEGPTPDAYDIEVDTGGGFSTAGTVAHPSAAYQEGGMDPGVKRVRVRAVRGVSIAETVSGWVEAQTSC